MFNLLVRPGVATRGLISVIMLLKTEVFAGLQHEMSLECRSLVESH